jgi:hypothetical protein
MAREVLDVAAVQLDDLNRQLAVLVERRETFAELMLKCGAWSCLGIFPEWPPYDADDPYPNDPRNFPWREKLKRVRDYIQDRTGLNPWRNKVFTSMTDEQLVAWWEKDWLARWRLDALHGDRQIWNVLSKSTVPGDPGVRKPI